MAVLTLVKNGPVQKKGGKFTVFLGKIKGCFLNNICVFYRLNS